MVLQHRAGLVDLLEQHIVAPQVSQMLQHLPRIRFIEQAAIHDLVPQYQPPVTGQIHIHHFYMWIDPADIVLARKLAAHPAITTLIVDGGYAHALLLGRIVGKMEKPQLAHQVRAEKLGNEALIAIIGPDIPQHRHMVACPGDFGEPLPILGLRISDDPLDILHHCKADGMRVEPRIMPVIELRLKLAAEAGFVIALYNPISKARPWQLGKAFEILHGILPAETPVIFGRAAGRPDERLSVVPIKDADASVADMATCVIIGSPETRIIPREGRPDLVYTPRFIAVETK